MIHSCPSCGTLYRTGAPLPARRARCACCDGEVPVAQRRPYAVHVVHDGRRVETLVARADWPSHPHPFRAEPRATATVPGTAAATIGMDDPALAPRLARTALDEADPCAVLQGTLTWTHLVEDEEAEAIAATAEPETASAATAAESAPDPVPMRRRPGERLLRPVLVGLAGGALGGFAGATWIEGSALNWWFGGALVGAALALGMCSPWTSQRD